MVDSSNTAFQNYQSGIITDSECGILIDRALTAVGYGFNETLNNYYFIVKNSLGTNWGESGYVKVMAVNGTNKGICGIQ